MNLIDFLWPKTCVGCGKWDTYICGKCEIGMEEEEQICPVCRRGSRYGNRHKYCHESWAMEGLTCFWKYEGLVKKLITEAKYNFYYDQLNELSERSWVLIERVEFGKLREFLGVVPAFAGGYGEARPVVVPVPLASKRMRERGFNQAQIIGESFASRHALAYDGHSLRKVKETEQQVGKMRQERLENLSGAFQVSMTKSQIPTNILLVDDVWTTGATLSECAKVLRQAGVGRVWGLVLAR